MQLRTLITGIAVAALTPSSLVSASEFELSGRISSELRYFTQEAAPGAAADYASSLSVAFAPELYRSWNDGTDSLVFAPYLRLDQRDARRSHGDIRELSWIHVGDGWELRSGIRRVFWGVTEFQHLVDIINQTDNVDDIDDEDKLGQPMVNLSLTRDWGVVDLFLLPGFRERTFAGTHSRLSGALPVATDLADYESAAGQAHLDAALRWSHTLDAFDLALYWFHGTSREPTLIPTLKDGSLVLAPYYPQIDQIGFDLQATLDNWLWKLEAITRDSASERFSALQAGVEYSFYGIADSAADLGVLAEWGWDERGASATSPAQNDLYLGLRLALNDEESSELLAGISYDLDHAGQAFLFEASRRIGQGWTLSLDGRFFSADDASDPLSQLDRQDHLQFTLERYF